MSRKVVIAIQGIAPLKGCCEISLQALELMDFQRNIGFTLVIENLKLNEQLTMLFVSLR